MQRFDKIKLFIDEATGNTVTGFFLGTELIDEETFFLRECEDEMFEILVFNDEHSMVFTINRADFEIIEEPKQKGEIIHESELISRPFLTPEDKSWERGLIEKLIDKLTK